VFCEKRVLAVANGKGVELNVVSPDFGFVIFFKSWGRYIGEWIENGRI